MTIGPGKYDDLCTMVRERAKADGAIVIIINGERGVGFSCQGDVRAMSVLPEMLESIARQIRSDIEPKGHA